MSGYIERHCIKEGDIFCITDKVRSGIDHKTGLPYWKMPVGMTVATDDGMDIFDYVWLRAIGNCPYVYTEWVRITKIKGITCTLARNEAGGKTVFRILDVEFERAKKKGE